jgi:hypothetical protein
LFFDEGAPSSQAADLVQNEINQGGRLGRTIHVAHYAGASVILRDSESHTKSKTEDSYIAWFQKTPKPVLLTVRRNKLDGAMQSYELGSDEALNFLIRAYGSTSVDHGGFQILISSIKGKVKKNTSPSAGNFLTFQPP